MQPRTETERKREAPGDSDAITYVTGRSIFVAHAVASQYLSSLCLIINPTRTALARSLASLPSSAKEASTVCVERLRNPDSLRVCWHVRKPFYLAKRLKNWGKGSCSWNGGQDFPLPDWLPESRFTSPLFAAFQLYLLQVCFLCRFHLAREVHRRCSSVFTSPDDVRRFSHQTRFEPVLREGARSLTSRKGKPVLKLSTVTSGTLSATARHIRVNDHQNEQHLPGDQTPSHAMHVEVSVALNFLISYLYNKLPRRRVDLFGEELEKGLKRKFEGHWYPDKPFKGSGFRCVRCNGENVDPVMVTAAENSGLDLQEVKNYIPEELTLWIDPSEVSYRICEKSPIKILYSDRHEDDAADTIDREVQAANRTFNPDAISFQPIDSLSSSLSNLSLSPSSPVPPGSWSSSASPSSALFSSDALSSPGSHLVQAICPQPLSAAAAVAAAASGAVAAAAAAAQPLPPSFLSKASMNRPQFTAATFAQTKFGSTKLKSQAKRPTRLSPTELGNYFRQQQRVSLGAAPPPQRPRSLSPRDPRLEFLLDQQHRMYSRGQLSPQGQHPGFGHAHHHHHHQQQLSFPPSPQGPCSPNCGFPFGGSELGHGSSSPHLSPGAMLPPFPDALPGPSTALSSPTNSLSPDGHKTFLDGLPLGNMSGMGNIGSMGYPGHLQHLLVAN